MTQTVANTPVIKGIGLHWSHLVTLLCSVCNSLGHSSLVCKLAGVSSIPKSKRTSFSAQDKFRLAKISEKKSVSVSRPLAFDRKTWTDMVGKPPFCVLFGNSFLLGSINSDKPILLVGSILEIHLVSIKSSLVNLADQISELTKRLDSLIPMMSAAGDPLFPPSQIQKEDTVMEVGLSEATNDETATIVILLASLYVVKLKKMLKELSKSVLSLFAYFDGLVLASSVSSQTLSQ
ncbi:hypothetical protein G9A89_017632 [Geosiphon pyriformis]|nr:hypothetical protein G9A89_017632 [Geosiphon pyriformis]